MVTASVDSPGAPLRWVHRAIVFVDIVESVALMRRHEQSVIERWRRFVETVRTEVLPVRNGRFVKSTGDGFMLEFPHASLAAVAALDVQRRSAQMNHGHAPDAAIVLRAGIHIGNVVDDPLDMLGDAANFAARIMSLAQPGETVVSSAVRAHLVPGVDPEVEDLGERFAKHIDEPLRVFRLRGTEMPRVLHLPTRPEALRPAIAVMPFEVGDGHDPAGALGEALATEVTASLSRQSALQVVSSLSTRSLKGRNVTVAELAAQLGVAYVASGRYRRHGSLLRLNLELAECRSSTVVWADTLEFSAADVFAPEVGLADDIAQRLASQIVMQEVRRAVTLPLPALESYTLLFGAISLVHRLHRDSLDRAQRMLEHLAERLGRNGVPEAWIALSHVLRVAQGWSPDPMKDSTGALAHVERSLEADPTNGMALAIGGLVQGYLRKDLAGAGRLYDQALQANPNEPLAWLLSSTRRAYLGDGEQAEAEAEQALRLSPVDPMRYFFDSLAATALCGGGHWERAAELAQRSVRANRVHASTWRTLAYALVQMGRIDEARVAVQELLQIEPALTVGLFRERFPGRDGPMAEPWARSLAAAGLPE